MTTSYGQQNFQQDAEKQYFEVMPEKAGIQGIQQIHGFLPPRRDGNDKVK